MLRYNALNINGVSTETLPFLVIVEVNAAPTMAKRKDIFHDNPMVNGRLRQTVNAWESVEKTYDIYLHHATGENLRQFKSLLKPKGWYISHDDKGVFRRYDEVTFESETLSEIDGYHVHVTFICEPFEYEVDPTTISVTTNNYILKNHTNAPMYPRLTVHARSDKDLYLQIGNRRMVFKGGINGTRIIECRHREQNVWNQDRQLVNNTVKGPFFEVDPGNNTIIKSPEISRVDIEPRWGWI